MSMHELFDGSAAHELTPYDHYKALWSTKTTRRVEREAESMRRYMQRHTRAYAWQGRDATPPGCIGDGDKLSALREILAEREAGNG